MYEKIIVDVINEKALTTPADAPNFPHWSFDYENGFVFNSQESFDEAINLLEGSPGQFVGQNPPPR